MSPERTIQKGGKVALSLSKILIHLVFSTKNREPWISKEIQQNLYAYLSGTCRTLGSECYRVGGYFDHIHMALILPRTLSMSELVSKLKSSSSKWMNENGQYDGKFSWQAGYGAFSLGFSQLDSLLKYIDNQEEHHLLRSFEEELIYFFHKYKVDYDEKYIWE